MVALPVVPEMANRAEEVAVPPINRSSVILVGEMAPAFLCQTLEMVDQSPPEDLISMAPELSRRPYPVVPDVVSKLRYAEAPKTKLPALVRVSLVTPEAEAVRMSWSVLVILRTASALPVLEPETVSLPMSSATRAEPTKRFEVSASGKREEPERVQGPAVPEVEISVQEPTPEASEVRKYPADPPVVNLKRVVTNCPVEALRAILAEEVAVAPIRRSSVMLVGEMAPAALCHSPTTPELPVMRFPA